MTRKHFRALAHMITKLPSDIRQERAYEIGTFLAKQNPRFDMSRFLAACGV